MPIRNPAFAVEHEAGRLTDFSLFNLNPLLLPTYSLRANGLTNESIALTNILGQFLQETQYVGELHFDTLPGQSSKFVPLTITDLRAVRADGTNVFSLVDGFGRVAIVGEEPMLEARRLPNGQAQLTVYGPPGIAVRLETTTVLSDSITWTFWRDVTLSGLSTNLTPVPSNGQTLFIRGRKL